MPRQSTIRISTLLVVMGLIGSVSYGSQDEKSSSPIEGLKGFSKESDFVSTIRRADIVADRGFNFRVTYKNYIKEPYRSIFKLYVMGSSRTARADVQISMCSATEVCVLSGRGGTFREELHRTEVIIKNGSLDFTIPAELIPMDTDMPRGGVLLWSQMPIDNILWRAAITNAWNSAEIPSWPKERFAPAYTRYRNFLELI